jgi:hypothetical protein
MSDIHIKYERTGGFAGLKISTSFDLEDLPDEREQQLRDLLDEMDFFKLPVQILPVRPGSDQFTYKIEVDANGRKHSVMTTDSVAPEKIRQLIEVLNIIARTHRKKD